MAPIRVIGRKQKLFELLTSEEGNADRSKALAAGAVLGGSALAQMLLAGNAHADACAWQGPCNEDNRLVCIGIDPGVGFECRWSCPSAAPATCYIAAEH